MPLATGGRHELHAPIIFRVLKMRKILQSTAILTMAFCAVSFANPASTASKATHFTFQNEMSYPVTVRFFDFIGSWKHPIPQYFTVTLSPGRGTYANSLSVSNNQTVFTGDNFAGIEVYRTDDRMNSVTMNTGLEGAYVFPSNPSKTSLYKITHVVSTPVEDGNDIDVTILK